MSPADASADGRDAPSAVELTTVPMGRPPPFPVDAIVREEDTFLVLGAGRGVEPPAEDLGALLRRAAEARERVPGTVEVRGGRPTELLAVVHDLGREPTWREGWVESALEQVFREAGARGLRRLALPLLGAVHGRMHPYRFLALLAGTLARVGGPPPSALCLQVPRRVDPRDARALAWLWSDGAVPRAAGAGPPLGRGGP